MDNVVGYFGFENTKVVNVGSGLQRLDDLYVAYNQIKDVLKGIKVKHSLVSKDMQDEFDKVKQEIISQISSLTIE